MRKSLLAVVMAMACMVCLGFVGIPTAGSHNPAAPQIGVHLSNEASADHVGSGYHIGCRYSSYHEGNECASATTTTNAPDPCPALMGVGWVTYDIKVGENGFYSLYDGSPVSILDGASVQDLYVYHDCVY